MSADVVAGQLGIATPIDELLGRSDAEMDAEFADYAALGVSWLRMDFFWSRVEPTKGGGYNFTQLDKIVAAAEKYGIEIIGLLNGKPKWTSAGFTAAEDAVAYGKFVTAIATHFGDKVDYWEVINEPNINGIAAVDYTRMLKAAYTAIKAVDAGDLVITGGLSPVPQTTNGLIGAAEYLNQMYAAGAKGYFDAIGFHPYGWPLLPEDSKSWNGWQIMEDGIRKAMIANGQADVKVWITEIGAPTSGSSNALTAAQQVMVLEQSVKLAQSYDWAGPVIWYSYQDRGTSATDTESWYGLLGPNGEKKAAYFVYQNYATHDDLPAAADPVVGPIAIFGAQTNDVVVGNDLDNVIKTRAGNDSIDGGKGHDLLDGGTGDDVIVGGDGDDILIGGLGNDKMTGGAGKDVFVFSEAGWEMITDFEKGDIIDLSLLDANTTMAGKQSFTFVGSKWLSKVGDLGIYQDKANNVTYVQAELNGDGKHEFDIRILGLHNLTLDDIRFVPATDTPTFNSTNHTGTAGNDVMIGNAKDNVISGIGGNDILKGGAGNDVLVGHLGDDVLWGGAGNDRFDFNDAKYFGTDVIMDFETGDKIDLSDTDANYQLAGKQNFTFVGSAALSKAGDLGVYQDVNRGTTEVRGYTNNDTVVDFTIKLDGLHDLKVTDFIL